MEFLFFLFFLLLVYGLENARGGCSSGFRVLGVGKERWTHREGD